MTWTKSWFAYYMIYPSKIHPVVKYHVTLKPRVQICCQNERVSHLCVWKWRKYKIINLRGHCASHITCSTTCGQQYIKNAKQRNYREWGKSKYLSIAQKSAKTKDPSLRYFNLHTYLTATASGQKVSIYAFLTHVRKTCVKRLYRQFLSRLGLQLDFAKQSPGD